MPKLMIKFFSDAPGDVYELEQARYVLDFEGAIIVVEGQRVHSYDELTQLTAEERYRGKELVEVLQIPTIQGG